MVTTKVPQQIRTQSRAPSSAFVRLCLAFADFFSVAVAFILVDVVLGRSLDLSGQLTSKQFFFALLWPLIFWREGLYPAYGMNRPEKFQKYVMGSFLAGTLLVVIKPFLNQDFLITYPRIILTTFASIALVYPVRMLVQRLLYRLGSWGEAVVILGAGQTGSEVARILQTGPIAGLKPVAFFDDDASKRGSVVQGIPVMGNLADAATYAVQRGVHRVIIAIPTVSHEALMSLMGQRGQVFSKVQFIPHLRGMPVHSVGVSSIDNYLALEFQNNLRLWRNQVFKRFLDILGAFTVTLLISPFLLCLALLVKLDSRGPVVYSQKRVGRNGKHFKVYKFRTMVVNADEMIKQYLQEHPELRDEWEQTHKLKNDPRVTRVGQFLRKYSLDELPQLWNVLSGDMGLVGPRPIVDAEIAKYQDSFDLYCLVRPGMTGYWQVSGRSDTSYDRRVQLDSFYIRNWSIWLDIIILFATVRVVLRGSGAY
jgi:Undecaprenyl-phosphate galactose phosphotransferase WbaP